MWSENEMAALTICLSDDPILRKKAKPVREFGPLLKRLTEDMAETMHRAPGIGLAAPQVGDSRRVIVADIGEGVIPLVNPKILAQEGSAWDTEGCLSFPNLYGEVERAEKVTVKAQDESGKWKRIEAEGLLARVFQHEIDHLDGILFIDKAVNLREILPEQIEAAQQEAARSL